MTSSVTRREILVGAFAFMAAKGRITKANVSAITDELGATQTDALDFARIHGLGQVELRTVPGTKKEFAFLTEPELKRYATELAGARLKVSLLKTSLLKFQWDADAPRWNRRKEDLAAAIRAAQILGTDKIRTFTGARGTGSDGVVRAYEELLPLAESAKVRLVIENEPSQNIGTSAEVKAFLAPLPSKALGFDWDPWNALVFREALHEASWVEGYRLLPKDRMLNVQIKAESLGSPDKIRWKSLLEALQKDGYAGTISLATEGVDADDPLREILHIAGQL